MEYVASPHDACQQPNHRWLRCQYLLECDRPPSPQDDAITREAYAFLTAWRRCSNDAQREHVSRAHPALVQAVQLYQIATSRQRGEVEARLLAGQDNKSIAAKCNISAEVVHLFHELFFDVRSRLQAEFYIINVVIGPQVDQGLQCDDYDVLLKLAGYSQGPLGVDALLAYWTDPPVWPVSLANLDEPALEALYAKLRTEVWIQLLILPANADTAAQLPAVRRLLAQAGALGQGSASDENSLLSACRAALDCRAFLSAPEVAAGKVAQPASAGMASSVGHRNDLGMTHPEEWQAVPA